MVSEREGDTPRADAPAEVNGFQVVLDASGPASWSYSVGFTDGSLILDPRYQGAKVGASGSQGLP